MTPFPFQSVFATIQHACQSPYQFIPSEQCEMLFTVCLPGAGKTSWARRYVQEHPHKRYVIIGVDDVMEQMKVGAGDIGVNVVIWL